MQAEERAAVNGRFEQLAKMLKDQAEDTKKQVNEAKEAAKNDAKQQLETAKAAEKEISAQAR